MQVRSCGKVCLLCNLITNVSKLISIDIQCFKLFLEAIAYGNDSPDRVAKQTILLKYLKAETPPEDDRSAIYLTELIQTWGFAAQSNNEGLLSALPALLALLLKTISSLIDFRDYGVLLCKTLLRKDQLKLFDRALTANKTKEHLISPCLRLLTEIVSFDGGSSARSLYLHRDISFKRLEIFLRMRKQSPGSTADDQRRPSVRRNAQKYLLANLRLQDPVAKADILSQSKIVRGLLEDLSDDPPEAICDVLGVLKKNVVSDESLPRIAKSRLLTDWTLSRIATLYGYDQDGDDLGEIPDIKALAHAFLLFVCTSLNHGVLVAQRGWYPPGAAASDAIADVNDDSAGIAELASQDRYTNRVPVRNTTLAAFLQVLRPYASSLQSDLALAIFEAAPELVADYFFKKKNFSFDPKLSATWIGYAAFLFSTIRLPIPSYKGLLEGADRPFPPVSIVIESILPQTLNHKSLTKCLNQNTSLITLFAIRLMTIAFQKLEKVLVFYSSPDSSNGSQRYKQQKQAALSLKAEFCRRCAEMKHVIAVFRNCSRENFVLREAVSRLLALYYKVIPQIALDEKFDISVVLSEALTNLGSGDRDVQDSGLCRLELKHLLDIAHRSPDMRWWQEPGMFVSKRLIGVANNTLVESMSLSPFTTILRLHINATGLGLEDNVRALLGAIIRDNAILQQATETSSLDALLASLGCYGDWRASDTVYGFLDNCILRLVRKPIKYCGDVANIANISSSGDETQGTENITISLLLIVILEQWSFLVNTAKATDLISVAHWLARYLEFSKHIGEDLFVLHHIRDQLRIKVQDKDCRLILKNALAVPRKIRLPDMVDGKAISTGPETDTSLGVARQRPLLIWDSISNSVLPSAPPDEAEDYPGLNRWTQKDLSNAVEENAVGDLLLCLCSKEEEVRRQAILNLRILMRKLEVSEAHPTVLYSLNSAGIGVQRMATDIPAFRRSHRDR